MILRRDESARSGRKAGAAIWIHQIAKARAGVIMTIVIIVPLNQLHHNAFLPMLSSALQQLEDGLRFPSNGRVRGTKGCKAPSPRKRQLDWTTVLQIAGYYQLSELYDLCSSQQAGQTEAGVSCNIGYQLVWRPRNTGRAFANGQ